MFTLPTPLAVTLLYAIMAIAQATYFLKDTPTPRWVFWTGLLPLVGHGVLLYHWIEVGIGQNLPWLVVLSLMAWLMGLVNLTLPAATRSTSFTILIYPFAALTIVGGWAYPLHNVVQTADAPFLLGHILFSLFALSVLGLAAVQAALFALQRRRLVRAQSVWSLLPPLEAMEASLHRLLWLGFLTLSVGLVFGVMRLGGPLDEGLYSKALLSCIAWGVFAGLLFGRHRYRWGGQRVVRATLFGVALLMIGYLLSEWLAP